MKRHWIAGVLALVLVLPLAAQIIRPSVTLHHAEQLGLTSSAGLYGLPTRGLELLLAMGPDGEWNPHARWTDRATQLFTHSADLTGWSSQGTPVLTAATAQDDDGAGYEYIYQDVAAPDATTYTRTIWVLQDAVVPATRFPRFQIKVNTSYVVNLDTASGATLEVAGLGGSHTVTTDGACWKLVMTFTTDDANGIRSEVHPARGANADLTTSSDAAVGTITILRQQLTPGTSSGKYEATGDRQTVYNWAQRDRRNLLEYSEEADNGWGQYAGTISANAIANPINAAVTADKLVPDAGAGADKGGIYQSASVSGAGTLSVYAKGGDGFDYASLRFNAGDASRRAWFNLTTGAMGTIGGLLDDAGIESLGDGWYRLWAVFTGIIRADVLPADSDNSTTVTGDGSKGIYVWGMQIEEASSLGAYQLKDASNVGWLDATVGSSQGDTTNDPGDALWRKNLLVDGSTEDLQVGWDTSDVTVDDADNLTFDAQNGFLYQTLSTLDGVSYTISFEVQNIDGNTALHFVHGSSETGNTTAQEITGSLVRYSLTVLGRSGGGDVDFGVGDLNAAGHGQVKLRKLQVEVGPLTDYNADDRQIVAARGAYTTDDYLTLGASMGLSGSEAVSLFALVKSSYIGTAQTIVRENNNFIFRIQQDTGLLECYVYADEVGGSAFSAAAVNDGGWHLLGCTYDGGQLQAYVDGSASGSPVAVSGALDASAGDFIIGSNSGLSHFMEGTIAFVAAYSVALSPAEVLRFYKTVKTWWSLDKRGKKNLVLQ